MEFGNVLVNMCNEIILFDSFECLMFLCLFLIENRIKISIKKSIFHIFMLGVLDYLISNFIPIPISMQIVVIIVFSLYFSIIFKRKFIKTVIINTKVLCFLFIAEITLVIIIKYLFNAELISMGLTIEKFIWMLPIRAIELLSIYVYYRLKFKLKEVKLNYEKNI